ncbi:hypothetical protein MAR_020447, partial [Mya arenaria]
MQALNMERKFFLTKDVFPRYANTSKSAEQLDKKGTCLRSIYHSVPDPPLDFSAIGIAIKSCHLNSLSADELQYKKTFKKEGRSKTAQNGDQTTKEKRKGCINPQITITTYDDVQHGSIDPFKDITGDILIIVGDNLKEADKALRSIRRILDKTIITMSCSREQIAMTICTTLETFVLRKLKSRITALKVLYDQLKPVKLQIYQAQAKTREQINGENGVKVESIVRSKRPIDGVDTPSFTRSAHALYRRSGISQDESPFVKADVPVLSD